MKNITDEEVKEALQGLINKGIVEVTYDEAGNKLYSLTKMGKLIAPQIDPNLN